MQILSEEVVEQLTVDGLAVRKTKLELKREHVAGIKLELRTVGDRSLQVELVETFPGHFSMGDVQVHPSYHPECWRTDATGHRLVLETEVEPGTTFETIYGFRVGDGDLEPFLEKPEVVTVEPAAAAPDSGAASPGKSEASDGPGPDSTDDLQRSPPEESHSDSTDDPQRSPPEGSHSDSPEDPLRRSPEGSHSKSTDEPLHGQREEPQLDATRTEPAAGPGAGGEPSDSGFEFGEERRERAVESHGWGDETPVDREPVPAAADSREQRAVGEVDIESRLADLSELATAFDEVVSVVDSSAQAVVALSEAQEALGEDVETLSSRAKAAAGDRDALRRRVETLEGAVEHLHSEHDADVDDLDARLAELEQTFGDSEEFAAIRDVVAAERAWRQRSRPTRAPGSLTASTGPGDR